MSCGVYLFAVPKAKKGKETKEGTKKTKKDESKKKKDKDKKKKDKKNKKKTELKNDKEKKAHSDTDYGLAKKAFSAKNLV